MHAYICRGRICKSKCVWKDTQAIRTKVACYRRACNDKYNSYAI